MGPGLEPNGVVCYCPTALSNGVVKRSDKWNEGLVPSILAGELFLSISELLNYDDNLEKERNWAKRKKAIIQTEEKFGAQSSNAKSERQREFGIIIIPKVRTCGSWLRHWQSTMFRPNQLNANFLQILYFQIIGWLGGRPVWPFSKLKAL